MLCGLEATEYDELTSASESNTKRRTSGKKRRGVVLATKTRGRCLTAQYHYSTSSSRSIDAARQPRPHVRIHFHCFNSFHLRASIASSTFRFEFAIASR